MSSEQSNRDGLNALRVRLIAARLTSAPDDEVAADLALVALGLNDGSNIVVPAGGAWSGDAPNYVVRSGPQKDEQT